ncbi:MAG: hypothetical protein HGA98_04555, partial [Deltaproteobacteria bacterium]|nr:hypothetical protein [Deltaproteobacteria bacterium]
MDPYWDCSLCRVEEKGAAPRCRTCCGRLKGRDRLLRELVETRRHRPRASLLSSLVAGLGQLYARRWGAGIAFGVLVPLTLGLVAFTWRGFGYGHLFVVAAALFIAAVAALDAFTGPTAKRAPCQLACPADVVVPDYLQLIVDGDWAQGYALLRTRVPLAGVIGRVCPHPCERRCSRGIDGEPISINGCKRFLA